MHLFLGWCKINKYRHVILFRVQECEGAMSKEDYRSIAEAGEERRPQLLGRQLKKPAEESPFL